MTTKTFDSTRLLKLRQFTQINLRKLTCENIQNYVKQFMLKC